MRSAKITKINSFGRFEVEFSEKLNINDPQLFNSSWIKVFIKENLNIDDDFYDLDKSLSWGVESIVDNKMIFNANFTRPIDISTELELDRHPSVRNF